MFVYSEGAESQGGLKFNVFTLTRIGREILTLASFPIQSEYLELICDLGISQGAEEVLIGELSPDRTKILQTRTIAKKSVSN